MGTKNRNRKRNAAAAKAKAEAVAFDFSGVDEQREAPVKVGGYKPFKIVYRVPDGDSKLGILYRAGDVADAGAASGDVEGMTVRTFVERHLVSWTLKQEVTTDSIKALAKGSPVVLAKLFEIIAGAGGEAKN